MFVLVVLNVHGYTAVAVFLQKARVIVTEDFRFFDRWRVYVVIHAPILVMTAIGEIPFTVYADIESL